MLVVMDVGNTQTVIGIYGNDTPEMLDHWRTVDDESNMAGLLAAFRPD